MEYQPPLILVVDIETTSARPQWGGIVEIGAHWLTGPREGSEFEIKCRPPFTVEIQEKALEVNGCDWLNDMTVPPESEAIERFLEWVGGCGENPVLLAGNNPRFDWEFLQAALARRNLGFCVEENEGLLKLPFPHRQLDLHTLAIASALANSYPCTGNGLYTDAILGMLNLPPEPKPHRALCGARSEAEAFRLLLGLPFIFDQWSPGPLAYGVSIPLPVRP